MNKSQLVDHISQEADLSRAAAARALDAALSGISSALRDAEPVALACFGTFSIRERAARTGRNPQTGQTISIAASRGAAFKPAKALKEALN